MQNKELRTTEAQRRASLKWERENTDKITIKLRKDQAGHRKGLERDCR